MKTSCDEGEVILMHAACYGKMKIGKCVKRNLGYVGCAGDVLMYLDSKCSGRTCDVNVMDPQLRNLQPCPLDVTWHLETVSARCLQGKLLLQMLL